VAIALKKKTAAVASFKSPGSAPASKPTSAVASFKASATEPTQPPPKKQETDKQASSRDPSKTAKDSAKATLKPAPPPARSYFRAAKAPPAGASWAPYYRAPWKRGYVTLFGHGKKWSGYLMGPKGEVPPASRASLSSMLASWRTGKETLIDERLIALIALASDEFGGRALRIVSGYREHSYAPDSKHKSGQALDFSIPGVPNEALRDYLRTLGDVGIGYYPNSTHIHIDVRDKTTYWVDYSFPGERPHYAYEPSRRGWGPRERAIADALDHLPSTLNGVGDAIPLSGGKPAAPFMARPATNRGSFAGVATAPAATTPRPPPPETPARASSSATPNAPDGGAGTTARPTGDSGSSFWSRAASATPDAGAPPPDGGSRSIVR
jgi:hypothetical protein